MKHKNILIIILIIIILLMLNYIIRIQLVNNIRKNLIIQELETTEDGMLITITIEGQDNYYYYEYESNIIK